MSQPEMQSELPAHLMTQMVSSFSQVAAHLGHCCALPQVTVFGAGVQPGVWVGRGAMGPAQLAMLAVQQVRSTWSQWVTQSALPAHDAAHDTWWARHCDVQVAHW